MSIDQNKKSIIRVVTVILCIVGALILCAQGQRTPSTTSPSKRIVIAASAVLDGKGRVLRNTRIVTENSTIVAIDPKAGPVDYDLRGLTVLPGWIDAHSTSRGASARTGKMQA